MLSMQNRFAVGSQVNFFYPTHGNLNVLRSVAGRVEKTGLGPHGPFVTVDEGNGKIRSLSTNKIVAKLGN